MVEEQWLEFDMKRDCVVFIVTVDIVSNKVFKIFQLSEMTENGTYTIVS